MHRDVKPENILIVNGQLKITDFGLSKFAIANTRKETLKGFGSLPYVAPEGLIGSKNTIQMDIYSMGIVFYELATLNSPYQITPGVDQFNEWRKAHLTQLPKPLISINNGLPIGLQQMILKMLQKKSIDRCQNWEEVRELFSKSEMPSTDNTPAVEEAIQKRMMIDGITDAAEIENRKRIEAKKEFNQMVEYQLVESIESPLQAWIEEFNTKYVSGQMVVEKKPFEPIIGKFHMEILTVSRNRLLIEVQSIYDYKYRMERVRNDYDRIRTLVEEIEPTLDGRKIQAWGYVKTNTGKGYNVFLLEHKGELYGDWVLLSNRNHAFSTKERTPVPFPFDYSEFQRELSLISSMHIYVSEIIGYTNDQIVSLLKEII